MCRIRADNPTAHLWTVNGAYPAWVFTAHGSAGKSVAIYDLRGRRWTMSYLVPRHGALQGAAKVVRLAGQPGRSRHGGRRCGAHSGSGARLRGVRIDDAADRVVLQLKHAPPSVIDQLNAAHPGTYVIHNNGTRTLADVMKVERSLDFTR